MNIDILYGEISVGIYNEPLARIRENYQLRNVACPHNCLVLLIDFDTERMMNGIFNFIGNSTGIYARETVIALNMVEAFELSNNLKKILDIADSVGMNYNSIQKDRHFLFNHEISSWKNLHGIKWSEAEEKIQDMYNKIDYEVLYEYMIKYTENNIADIIDGFREFDENFSNNLLKISRQ